MNNGNDDREIDPEQTTSSGDWWRGPVTGRPSPANPPPAPAPYPRPNPYASGPNPYATGPRPYQSGPNPVPPVQNSYVSGPNMFPPMPPGGSPPPPASRGRIWLLAAVGALVVVVVTVVAIMVVTHDSSTTAAPASSTTTKPTTTSPHPATTTAPQSTLKPQIPGYQVDVPKDLQAAWDIPKDWAIDQSITIFGTSSDSIPAVGYAQDGVDYCTDNTRTTMFLSNSNIDDATAAATDVGAHSARIGYATKTSLTAGAPQQLSTTDGNLHGTFLETSGAFTSPAGCATTFSVYTFALSVGTAGKGSLVLTIVADTGIDHSVTADSARRLFASFRLL
ncbi:hypothetical protein [Nocardia sp. NPDC004722]